MRWINVLPGVLVTFALLLPAPAAAKTELYSALGEEAGISRLMETFLLEIAADERIVEHFIDTDIERLHRLLTEQICELVGGPCVYSGEDMVTVHTGMGISHAEFNALVENLMTAMDAEGIPVGAQNQLLALLAEMHPEVVKL
ncbi:group I truncated hemoglobin [Pseudidiomarina taiwanensis]|uniref:Group 1 truncated hemoglobin n=1 Tax=Pseudidiomarina taiwanensis TaxID=337250 RepID=A0A432ZP58_9GAMM|nr:group 1 truncated hemoglobin [Pseudidiomarina taiwanensis]RUO79626.1 group 1 truncated hemoglobin [Pseudidiomarina taiwanensis]